MCNPTPTKNVKHNLLSISNLKLFINAYKHVNELYVGSKCHITMTRAALKSIETNQVTSLNTVQFFDVVEQN